jgi:hypothetical protein
MSSSPWPADKEYQPAGGKLRKKFYPYIFASHAGQSIIPMNREKFMIR